MGTGKRKEGKGDRRGKRRKKTRGGEEERKEGVGGGHDDEKFGRFREQARYFFPNFGIFFLGALFEEFISCRVVGSFLLLSPSSRIK